MYGINLGAVKNDFAACFSLRSTSNDCEPRTELDSHANMAVVGRNAFIIEDSGMTCPVSGFDSEHGINEYRIVDAAVRYDCPVTGKSHILVMYGALEVKSSDMNLIPPFMLREAGWTVKDVPKIHCAEPDNDDHCLIDKDGNKIFMSLRGTFSGFVSHKPTEKEVFEALEAGNELVLTPETWDPGNGIFELNEESLVDYQGNVREFIRPRKHHNLITSVEGDNVGKVELPDGAFMILAEISSTFSLDAMHDQCEYREMVVELCTALGADGAWKEDYLWNTHEVKAVSAGKAVPISAEELSRVFQIDLPTAKQTLRVTSQRVKRTSKSALVRHYPTNDRMLRYRRLKRDFFMDTFFAASEGSGKWNGTSVRGFKCVQLFVSDTGFMFPALMKDQTEIPEAVSIFLKEVGAPDLMIGDGHKSNKSQDVKILLMRAGTTLRLLEEGTPWANLAELYIGIIKQAVRQDIKRTNSPKVFWCYCLVRKVRIHNMTASKIFKLGGQTPYYDIYGEEADISRDAQFDWYEWCYFYDNTEGFPTPKETLGRVLGPAINAGNEMSMWVLKSNGEVVPRRTLRRLNPEEVASDVEKTKRATFDALIYQLYGDSMDARVKDDTTSSSDEVDEPPAFVPYEDPIEEPRLIPDYDDEDEGDDLVAEVSAYDRFIHAELMYERDGKKVNGMVTGRAVDAQGKPIGAYNANPILNTAVYEVQFDDGSVREYAANAIAEAIYSQCDAEGWRYTLLDSIIDHKSNDEASKDRFVYSKSGARRLRKNTKGWFLKIRWKDGNEQWVPLKDMKESHPVEVAEYAVANKLSHEPAFAWWVPYTIKKKKVIIKALQARKKKKTHKYGIRVPDNVSHAFELDKANGNTYWTDAMNKEMSNNSVAFEIKEDDEPLPVGYTLQSGHMVFDVKMDLTRKARWVLDGHKTSDVDGSTYAGVVSRESVRIVLTYAALNDLDVWAADIQNAYLQAPTSQKHYIICGPEFGLENVGKRAIIKRALYGGKTAGKDFRDHLRSCMQHLGFQSCLADPDVWYRPIIKKNGEKAYEYVLLYVDDCMVASENGERILHEEIGKYFVLKPESIGPPTIYLGGQMRQVTLESGVKAWACGSSKYVQSAVENVKVYLAEQGKKLPERVRTPLASNYRPEIDFSEELDSGEASYYMSLIGILRWIVELGRVDIFCEVSMMSSHLALPRRGHLDQLYHIFSYLGKHHNAEMVFDPTYPAIDESKFKREDWSSTMYEYEKGEELPPNMPEPRGNGFIMRAFVDADHAGDSITRKSRSGFIVYLNNAPIYWLSKKQTGIETSSFGSEFTAMKHCCEYIRGLRYRLRMMGIPVMGPAYIYGDNQSVLYNTTLPDSILKKKSQSIAYHFVREGSARDEWRTAYINTHDNPADLLTKPLSGEKREGFVNMILHHVFSYCYVN